MKKSIVLSALIVLALISFLSCKKENNDDVLVSPGQTTGSTINATISGRVMDENDDPLTGVVVNAGGKSTTTDQFGIFVLKNINANKSRCAIEFTKAGFFYRQHCIIVTANSVNYVRIVMVSNTAAYTVQAAAGGTVALAGGSSVAFQPNSFVTESGSVYSGTVSLAVKHLSPGIANFGFTIPGGDLQGIDAGNNAVALYSYGMLGVELKGSGGESLQLAAGKPATLTFAISATQQATAPATIPLWYYDETKALWKEEGVATKTGNSYVGTVNHFTWWNCDFPGGMATVKGKFVDCNGSPVQNSIISIQANNGYVTYPVTDQNGAFSFLMAVNFTATAQFMANLNPPFSQNSQAANIPLLTVGQQFTLPDLVVQCPTRIAGTAQTCTGVNTDAMVLLKVNGVMLSYQYTATGAFSLVAPDNVNFQLEAQNAASSALFTGTSLAAPNILNAGNIIMCNTVSLSDNSFTLNSSNVPSQVYNMLFTNSAGVVDDSSQSVFTYMYGQGYAPMDFTISSWQFTTNDTVPGNTTGALGVYMTNGNNNYSIGGQNILCVITEVGPVGGKIKGTYVGPVNTYANGSAATGSITGSFSITRTQ